jgi:hypothetical protein
MTVIKDGTRKVLMRDSKNPDGAVLEFTAEEWEAFSGGMAAGNFDDVSGKVHHHAFRSSSDMLTMKA